LKRSSTRSNSIIQNQLELATNHYFQPKGLYRLYLLLLLIKLRRILSAMKKRLAIALCHTLKLIQNLLLNHLYVEHHLKAIHLKVNNLDSNFDSTILVLKTKHIF